MPCGSDGVLGALGLLGVLGSGLAVVPVDPPVPVAPPVLEGDSQVVEIIRTSLTLTFALALA